MTPIILENLPPFEPVERGDKRIEGLSCYLGTLLGSHKDDAVQLPCLEHMAGFFQVSELDVLDALHCLRRQGFDYHLQGSHLPLQFWIIRNENKTNKE